MTKHIALTSTQVVDAIRVSFENAPFENRSEERGRPQTNPRVYLRFEGLEALMASGVTEKQIRRAAFSEMRRLLGLDPKTVVVNCVDHHIVKTVERQTNMMLVIRPSVLAGR